MSLYLPCGNSYLLYIWKDLRDDCGYLITLLGSTPQLAAMMTLGSACSILVRSSLAANPEKLHFKRCVWAKNACAVPPKTTEWTAPSLAVASMEMTASGIKGMKMRILSPLRTPMEARAPASLDT